MDLQNEVDVHELLRAHAHVLNQTSNFINTTCLRCVIQLSIPDLIHSHPQPFMSLSQLISSLPINPAKANDIKRLMSLLTHSGFFHCKKPNEEGGEGGEAYSLTYAGRLLVKDKPLSMTNFLLMMLDPIIMDPWQHLSAWFQNDDASPFHTAHGMSFWECTKRHTEFNDLFNNAMLCDSSLMSNAIMLHNKFKCVFEGLESLIDVGGGNGTMVKAIAQSFPTMNCTVLDLPHVVAGLKGTDNNLKYVGGDMFEAIPNADAVLLKWILHDWGDEECVKILKKSKEVISSGNGIKKGNKVIIIEMVLDCDGDKDHEKLETLFFSDMYMMLLFNGRERNEQE